MAPTTRCKFRITGVKHGVPGSPVQVEMDGTYPDKTIDGFEHGEDHAFFSATPYAKVVLNVNNPYGVELFQAGEFVYADFTPAPNPYKQPKNDE